MCTYIIAFLQTFSVGMDGSPDILAARRVAKHIGSEHHEVIFTADDVLSVLDKVIYTLETADITTIRASCGKEKYKKNYRNNDFIVYIPIYIYT